MNLRDHARRSFSRMLLVLMAASWLLGCQSKRAASQPQTQSSPLMAYLGTFSSPLKDVLPTQVDLPPGNGRGIHLFRMNRETGELSPAGVQEMGTSPSCLVLNATGSVLYSANETDHVGE